MNLQSSTCERRESSRQLSKVRVRFRVRVRVKVDD